MDNLSRIDVIIPTTCEATQWRSLQRGIQSVRRQDGVQARVIVVVNGTRFEPANYKQLREMKELSVLYREQGGLPGAQRFGRQQVTAPFFVFLDDDDEYLPNALWHRIDGETPYFEWTMLAYRLVLSRRMEFVDIPTFRIHDSEFSLSKSDAYVQAEVGVLRKILKLNLHSDVTRSVRVKTGRAYHRLSTYHRRLGHLGRAWRYHLASLVYPGGAGFLPYSRRLLPFWPIDREDSSFR
jgi:Glycosyl transferase family 2